MKLLQILYLWFVLHEKLIYKVFGIMKNRLHSAAAALPMLAASYS